MRSIGGLAALRLKCLTDSCIVTGEFGGNLKPAIVTVAVEHGDGKMSISGMVRDDVKAGRRDIEGRKVLSVIRKDVTVAIRKTKDGLTFMDGTVKGSGDGWMSADDLMKVKEVERKKADEEVSKTITQVKGRNLTARSLDIGAMWAGIRRARDARTIKVVRARQAS